MDIGSVGWLLRLRFSHPDHVDTGRYRYFFFMNTSVRGPILPPFLEALIDWDASVSCPALGDGNPMPDTSRLFSWFHVYLAQLNEEVRLAGSTIGCAFATHIQSYVLALDYVALQVLWQSRGLDATAIVDPALRERFETHQRDMAGASDAQVRLAQTPIQPLSVEEDFCRWQRQGGLRPLFRNFSMVLACHVDFWDVVFNAEIGVSQAVLRAGYGIAALEPYWRGVDFRLAPDLCGVVPKAFAHLNHYETGVPLVRLRPFDGTLGFNDPTLVLFTKMKTNKQYPTDTQLKAHLAWEELHNRTVTWQQAHNLTTLEARARNLSLPSAYIESSIPLSPTRR